MSQAGGPGEIGKLSVTVTGNIDPLKAKLKEGEAAAAASGQKIAAAANAGGAAPLFDAATTQRVKDLESAVASAGNTAGATAGSMARLAIRFTAIGAAIGVPLAGIRSLIRYLADLATQGGRTRQNFYDLQQQIERTFRAPPTSELDRALTSAKDKLDDADAEIRRKQLKGELNNQQSQALRDQARDAYEEERNRAYVKERERTIKQSNDRIDDAAKKKNEESFDRHQAMERLKGEQREEVENAAFDVADQRQAAQADRLKGLGQVARAISDRNPINALNNRAQEQGRLFLDALQHARSPMEAMLIQSLMDAWVKSIDGMKKNLEKAFRDAMLDALNSAISASSNGSGQVPSLLSALVVKTDAIRAAIPREGF